MTDTTPTPADRPADQLRDCLTAAVVETMMPLYGGPQHNTPGGLSLTATPEEARLHRARPIVEAVLTALPAPALAVARQLLGTTVCTCGTPGVGNYEGPQEDCPEHGVRPPSADRAALTETERPLLGTSECGPVPDSCGGEPCANHEREQAHAEGEHAFCGPECAAALAADYASCPGYETSPNPCRCPCYGCKHHCSAHQPPAAPPAPADRAAMLSELTDDLNRRRDMATARRLAADAAAGVQPPTTADRAAALGMTPTEYRQHSHNTAVQQIQAAAQGLFAGTAIRVADALKEPDAGVQLPTTEADTPFGAPDCTCIPWTRQGGTKRLLGPDDTVDQISGWEKARDCPPHAGISTLPHWLYRRFTSGSPAWDLLADDDRSYWEHQARAVERAVRRGGFNGIDPWLILGADQPTTPPAAPAAPEEPTR